MKQMLNLQEYIYPKMDVLFLALNAPFESNKNRHWFSRNLSFWNLLHNSGIITTPITNKLDGDVKVFGGTDINYNNHIYGVTDLNREHIETNSNLVSTTSDQVNRILQLLDRHHVNKLCIVHSKVGEAFRDYGYKVEFNGKRYGVVGQYKNTIIYEAPFHNAPINTEKKVKYYNMLVDGETNVIKKKAQKVKSLQAKKHDIPEMKTTRSFIIPDIGNRITKKDIDGGRLRITVEFKHYFPNQSCRISVSTQTVAEKLVSFTYKEGRSHVVQVGKDLMKSLGIHEGDRVKISIIKPKKSYLLQKL